MSTSRSRLSATLLGGVLVLAAAGCASSRATTGNGAPLASTVGTPTVSATPIAPTARGLKLPIEAFLPSAAVQNVVVNAEQKVASQCMARFGFTWSAPDSNLPELNQLDRAYGVTDAAQAARYGYHAPPSADSGTGKPAAGSTAAMSEGELLVLTGDPTGSGDGSAHPGSYQGHQVAAGGCYGEGRLQVTGVDQLDPANVADNILIAMGQRAKADARVMTAFGAWSRCMAQSGYRYPDPLAAAGDTRWSGGAASQAEIATAQADVACKRRTNLIGIWYGVESAFENTAIQQQLPALTQVRDRWDAAAVKAAGLLGVPVPAGS